MPFSVEVLPRLRYALRWLSAHKVVIALGIAVLLAAYAVFGQAVNRSGQKAIKASPVGGVRKTNPNFQVTFNPYWHESGADDDLTISDITLTRNVAYSLDLSTMASAPDGYTGTGTITFSDVSGSYPTGVSLQTSVACPTATAAYCVKGTPTTVQNVSKVIRATLDGSTTADATLTWDVISPDTQAPTPPNVPTITASSEGSLTIESLPCTDASGIDFYSLYRATSQGGAETQIATNLESASWTFTPPSTTSRWWSFSCTDNAGNESAAGEEINLPTSGGGGGGGSVPADSLSTDSLLNGRWTFEAGSTSGTTLVNGQGVNIVQNCDDCELTIQTSVVRAGNNALKARMAYSNAADDYHNEIRLLDPRCTWFQECWIGYSVCYPADNYNTMDGVWEIHAQMHSAEPGDEADLNPQFTLGYENSNQWLFNVRWNSTQPTVKASQNGTTVPYTQPPRGEWQDFVIRMVLDYRSSGNIGELDVWRNGTQIVNRNGPIGFNNTLAGFWKFGQYKNRWKNDTPNNGVTARTYYIDSIRFDSAGGSYDTVAPPGTRPSNCP